MKKKITGGLSALFLYASGLEIFVNIANYITMKTYNVKGYYAVSIGMILYIYSLFVKNKTPRYISIAITLGGYLYTFYTVSKIYDTTVQLEIGFYIYLISAIIFNVSLFLDNKSNETSENKEINTLKDSVNNKPILLTTYLFGIEKRTDLYKHSCALTYENNIFNILISSDNDVVKFDIINTNLKSINVKKRIIMEKEKTNFDDNSIQNQLLAIALFGQAGNLIGSTDIFNKTNYDNFKYNTLFEIEIIYNDNDTEKKFMLNSFKDPSEFFIPYSNIYSINK